MPSHPRAASAPRFPAGLLWAALGGTLIAVFAAAAWLSPAFAYGSPMLERPVGSLVALLVAAGAAYLAAVALLPRTPAPGRRWWCGMLGAGLMMRLVMLPAAPILEDDSYRYLWDGALLAHGHSPYRHAPASATSEAAPAPIRDLAAASGEVIERVNHPRLRTIYPLTAQAAFAVAHLAAPWSIAALRALWLVFDLATLILLAGLLRAAGQPLALLAVYWWNPIVIQQIHNAAHMDIVLLPFLLGALLCAARGRPVSAAALLGIACGAKLWPVILLPVLARAPGFGRRTFPAAAAAFLLPAGALAGPLLIGLRDPGSGLAAYAHYWQMNDLAYMLIHEVAGRIGGVDAHLLARGCVAALLAAWIAWQCRAPLRDAQAIGVAALWIIAALFLLSPTQYPWYAVWFAPLLALHRSPGLLLLAPALPLYYLRFPMSAADNAACFDYGVIWLEFGPVFALLAWEALRAPTRWRDCGPTGS